MYVVFTGPDAYESQPMEDAQDTSRGGANVLEHDCHDSHAPPSDTTAQPPCSSRKPSIYAAAGLCGWWASFWSATDCTRPSKEELKGRQPGQDGSRSVRCTLDTETGLLMIEINLQFLTICVAMTLAWQELSTKLWLAGAASCSEDAGAAKVVNEYLAEEVARACRNNKTHNCFSADLQAFKGSEHVKDAIKLGLAGLETYAQVGFIHVHALEKQMLPSD